MTNPVDQIKQEAEMALAPYSISVTTVDYYVGEEVETVFHDILGYQVNSSLVAISMKDGSTTVYPMSEVKRLRHFVTPIENRGE